MTMYPQNHQSNMPQQWAYQAADGKWYYQEQQSQQQQPQQQAWQQPNANSSYGASYDASGHAAAAAGQTM